MGVSGISKKQINDILVPPELDWSNLTLWYNGLFLLALSEDYETRDSPKVHNSDPFEINPE